MKKNESIDCIGENLSLDLFSRNIETINDFKKALKSCRNNIYQFAEILLRQSGEPMGLNILEKEMETIINKYLQKIENGSSLCVGKMISAFHEDIQESISTIVKYSEV